MFGKKETEEDLKQSLTQQIEVIPPDKHKFQITGECDDLDIQEIDNFVRQLHRMKIEIKYVSGKRQTFDHLEYEVCTLKNEVKDMSTQIKKMADDLKIAIFGAQVKFFEKDVLEPTENPLN